MKIFCYFFITVEYEPLVFLIPSESNLASAKLYKSLGDVPICAVYSSVPVEDISYGVIKDGKYLPIKPVDDPQPRNAGLYFVPINFDLLNQISRYYHSCSVKTIWEEKETNFTLTFTGKLCADC